MTFPHTGPGEVARLRVLRPFSSSRNGRVYVSSVVGRWLLVASCSFGLLSCSACGGSGKTVVPELRGKTIPQALRLLAGRHLCPSRQIAIERGSSTGRLPIVVDQDPRPQARVDGGAYVTISVRAAEPGTLVAYDAPCSRP